MPLTHNSPWGRDYQAAFRAKEPRAHRLSQVVKPPESAGARLGTPGHTAPFEEEAAVGLTLCQV